MWVHRNTHIGILLTETHMQEYYSSAHRLCLLSGRDLVSRGQGLEETNFSESDLSTVGNP